MNLLTGLFRPYRDPPRGHSRGDVAYAVAMNESAQIIKRMRQAAAAPNAVRSLMANIWLQRHNVPFVTTVFEAAAEMQSPLRGDTTAKAPPPKDQK